MPEPAILPRRGIHLRPGDVVKLTPAQRCRILSIRENGPLTVAGQWQIEDERAAILRKQELCRVSFQLYQMRFYTVEKGA